MKLIDLLKVTHKDVFMFVGISVCGMRFETRHSVEFYINNGDKLNERGIEKVYLMEDGLHVRLGEEHKQTFPI